MLKRFPTFFGFVCSVRAPHYYRRLSVTGNHELMYYGMLSSFMSSEKISIISFTVAHLLLLCRHVEDESGPV